MSDVLSSMREFRALDDKRRNQGLAAEEELRWNDLRAALKGGAKPAGTPAAAAEGIQVEAAAAAAPAAAPAPAPAEAVPAEEPAPAALAAAVLAVFDTAASPPGHAAAPEPAPEDATEQDELLLTVADGPEADAPPVEVAAAQPDQPSGYVFHEESGLYWHAWAQLWYEPNAGVHYDVNGGVVDADTARAAVAAATAASAEADEAEAPASAAEAPGYEAPASTDEDPIGFVPANDDGAALPPGNEGDEAAAPAADPWAATLEPEAKNTEAPASAGWDFVIAPVTPGPAAPSFDLWASTAGPERAHAATAEPEEEERELLRPELLPFEVSRIPVAPPAVAPGEIEAGFDGWEDDTAGPEPEHAAGSAAALPWDQPEGHASPEPAALEAEAGDLVVEGEPAPAELLVLDDAASPFEVAEAIVLDDDANDEPPGIEAIELADDPPVGEPVLAAPHEFLGVAAEDADCIAEQESLDEAAEGDASSFLAAPHEFLGAAAEGDANSFLATPEESLDVATDAAENAASFLAAPHEFLLQAEAGASHDAAEALELAPPAAAPVFELGTPAGMHIDEAETEEQDHFAPGPSLSIDGAIVAPAATPQAFVAEEAVLLDESDALEEEEAPAAWTPPAAAPAAPQAWPEPAPVRPAPAASSSYTARGLVIGEHRVVVHASEGVVKRGQVANVDLTGRSFSLQVGKGREELATAQLKAVFLMRAPGEGPAAPEGRSVRVTFTDGRPLQGWATDLADPVGFFLVPADTRGLASRVFVYRAAIRDLALD